MTIQTLSVRNFRNFHQIEAVEFPPRSLLVAVAPNATGKTNFLEGIVYLLRGKSFRASSDECVRWGEEEFALRGAVYHRQSLSSLVVRYNLPRRKLWFQEDSRVVSPVTFYSSYPLVLFLPEDTFLFARGPALRRNLLNHILACAPTYLPALVQFHRALRQRNAALKQSKRAADIEAWTNLVVEHALPIWQHRQMLVDFMRSHVGELYAELTGEQLTFDICLVAGAARIDAYSQILAEAWPYERQYSYTAYGPHRDDVTIEVNGRPIQSALSSGQIRGVVIALKIAAWRFMRQVTGEDPLVLLDDVLGELDERRQETLLDHLPAAQVVLTCTTLPASLKARSDVQFLDLRSIIMPRETSAVSTSAVTMSRVSSTA